MGTSMGISRMTESLPSVINDTSMGISLRNAEKINQKNLKRSLWPQHLMRQESRELPRML